MSEDQTFVALATIIVFGVGGQWVGRRVGIPSILLLLPAGLLAGDVFNLVEPEELFGDLLFPLVGLLLGLLLFQAGLQLRVRDLPRRVRASVVRLVTVGGLITFVGASLAVWALIDTSFGLAVMTGAIVVVSGPTVVGPLLAVVRPVAPTGSVLNWESTVLDPIGATAGVVVFNLLLASERGGLHPVMQMLGRLAVGVGVGTVCAVILVFFMSRFLLTDDMEPSVALLFAVVAFTVAEVTQSEAGLFAAVTMGVVAANQGVVATHRIVGVGETLDVLIIGTLFITLGALVEIDDLVEYALPTAGLVAILILVVRPLASGVALTRSPLPWRDRAFIAAVDPRGIVAAATAAQFAGRLGNNGYDTAFMLPVVFGVILGTGVVYGLSAPFVARWLGVARPKPTGVGLLGNDPWLEKFASSLAQCGARVLLVTTRPPPPDELVAGASTVEVAPVHGKRPGPLYAPAPADADIETATDPTSQGSITTLSLHAGVREVEEAIEAAAVADMVVSFRRHAVYALVVSRFIEVLGRRSVLLVPEGHSETGRRTLLRQPGEVVPRLAAAPFLVSEPPFRGAISRADIDERLDDGWRIDVVDGAVPPGALVLAAVDDHGRVDLQVPQPGEPERRGRRRRGHRSRTSNERELDVVALLPPGDRTPDGEHSDASLENAASAEDTTPEG